ncbi:MAG TPA: FliM/FliN family flagellar motor switch protein [Polyangiaceae bacterium]|nr:FliM/FliN family flagellar motor switch protein [Polyangiaceae bacterium]
MQRAPEIAAFPWSALELVDRLAESNLWTARRWLERSVEISRLAAALGSLVGSEVRIFKRSVRARSDGPSLRLGFRPQGGGAVCVLGLEPALAAALLSSLFHRSVPVVGPDAVFDASAHGALSAIFIEAARASEPSLPFEPCKPDLVGNGAAVEITVVLSGKPYAAVVWVSTQRYTVPLADDASLLGSLGEFTIGLPLVVALASTTPRALAELAIGAAFCAGTETWIDARGAGRGVLVSAQSERGLGVELGPEGRIVLREPARIPLTSAEEPSMSTDDSGPPTLAQAVLDAPVVVRVELGSVSMSAREWAALRPGDVLQTGHRLGEPVLLRAGGRVVARGELVNVEGEVGVRVLEVGSDANA